MHVEVRVDPAVICPAEVVIVIPSFQSGGVHHIDQDDGQDNDGSVRQAPMRSLRPTERRRVNVRAGDES